MSPRLGIIGAGYLTQASIVPALRQGNAFHLRAVLDASLPGAQAVASHFPDALATSGGDEFFAQEMEAVYIATPNHTHALLAIRALESGFSVLVEKPLAASVADGAAMAQAAANSGRTAMTAYMAKFNAANLAARKLVEEGRIGRLQAMHAYFSIHYPEGNWRLKRSQAGHGALGDVGIYPVTTAVDLFGGMPRSCHASAFPAGDAERTDIWTQATVLWPEGGRLTLTASFAEHTSDCRNEYMLVGEKGMIQVVNAWSMGSEGDVFLWDNSGRQQIAVEHVNAYAAEFHAFGAAIGGAALPESVSFTRGCCDLVVLEAIARSASLGGDAVEICEIGAETHAA